MSKLIVPFDFSVHAENALGYAIGLAQNIGASITIFHVFDVPVPTGYEDASLTYNMALANQERKKLQARLDTFIEGLGKIYYTGTTDLVQFNTVIRQSDLEDGLTAHLKHNNHNLVIMGTRGVQGWEELLKESSNTANMAELAHTSVLVVPLGAKYEGVRHIIYASNFDRKDASILQELSGFNDFFGAKMTCLHVANDASDEATLEQLEILSNKVDNRGIEGIDFKITEDDNVEQALFSFAQDHSADMLAVMPKERDLFSSLFHRSISKQLTHHTTMPLLVIK